MQTFDALEIIDNNLLVGSQLFILRIIRIGQFLEDQKLSKLNLLHPLYLFIEKKVFNKARLIIAISEMVKRDIVSGAVIAVIVVVSFLSLMSFAEFLRFEWAGPDQDGAAEGAAAPAGRGGGGGRRRNRNRGNRGGGANGAGGDRIIPAPIEGEVDDIVRPADGFRDSYQLESDDDDLNIDFPPTIPPDFELGRVLLNHDDDVMLDQLYGDDLEKNAFAYALFVEPISPLLQSIIQIICFSFIK